MKKYPKSFQLCGVALALLAVSLPRPARAQAGDEVYSRARSYAMHTLRLDLNDAESFARDVVSHSQARESLDRFRWAYSQFNLKKEIGRQEARDLADTVAALTPEQFSIYSQAFHFAFSSDEMDLDTKSSRAFAAQALTRPLKNFQRFRTAYRHAMTNGVVDARGNRLDIQPKYARMFAESASSRPTEALDRYGWAFANSPAKSESDFAKTLGLAEQLADLSPKEYQSFRVAVLRREERGTRRNHVTPPEAIEAERAKRGWPVTASAVILESHRSTSSARHTGQIEAPPVIGDGPLLEFFPATPGIGRGQIVLGHPTDAVPGAGCADVNEASIRDFATGIPGFDASLRAVQTYNMKLPAHYKANVPTQIRKSIKAASEAFGMPERVLLCSLEAESSLNSEGLHNNMSSHTGAHGVSQIEPDAGHDIVKIIRLSPENRDPAASSSSKGFFSQLFTSRAEQEAEAQEKLNEKTSLQDLSRRWAGYVRYQRALGNAVPATGGEYSKRMSANPYWSIGAMALWTKHYERTFYGPNHGPLDVRDYAMVVGSYNMGVGGFKKVCQPYDFDGCLRRLSRYGPQETYNHILKVNRCLTGN